MQTDGVLYCLSVPGIPTELRVEIISLSEIILRWNLKKKNGVITYYQVTYYEKNQKENVLKLVKNTTKTSISITGLKPKKTYFLQVRNIAVSVESHYIQLKI